MHSEVYRAKSEIDSLIYKLNLDLTTFTEKKTLAALMQEDAEKLFRVAKEEIAMHVEENSASFGQSCQGARFKCKSTMFDQTRR